MGMVAKTSADSWYCLILGATKRRGREEEGQRRGDRTEGQRRGAEKKIES